MAAESVCAAVHPCVGDVDAEINSVIAERGLTKASEYRKVIKPLLEKRRRARINHSLTELKELLVDAYKSDISEPSKLEKADILELTVRHLRDLRRLQRHRPQQQPNTDYVAGFTECANEVAACVENMPALDAGVRARLLTHLAKRVGRVDPPTHTAQMELHSHHHSHHPGSLTPPPSPRTCNTPANTCDNHVDSIDFSMNDRSTSIAASLPALPSPLPAGYVSLAVLMSHKESQAVSSGVWRPW